MRSQETIDTWPFDLQIPGKVKPRLEVACSHIARKKPSYCEEEAELQENVEVNASQISQKHLRRLDLYLW